MSDESKPFDQFLTICFRLTIFLLVIYYLYISLNGKPSGLILVVALLFLYAYTYINGRLYLETFDDCRPIEKIVGREEVEINTPETPYTTIPINSVDDYEISNVFDNENDKELTKAQRNKLMSQYPLDWTVQPPSSTHFQAGIKETFTDASGSHDASGSYDGSGAEIIYRNVNGGNVMPQDTDSAEINERQLLKTYVPKNANDLKTYDVDDAYTLIKNMYSSKGLIPEVEHEKDTNIYKIVATHKKGEKVTYEDEPAEASNDPVASNGEGTIQVPRAATDMLNDSDPFYNTSTRTRQSKFDYTKFTPGLERVFAPSYPLSQWY